MDQNKSINYWRIFQIATAVSLALIYLIQWAEMISSPSLRTGTDFIHFYAAGKIAQENGYPSVYNLTFQHKIEQSVVGFDLAQEQVLPFNHMPYLLPFLKFLINSNYIGSFIRWDILMFVSYITGSIFFLRTILQNRENKIQPILMLGAVTFYPFFVSLLLGQDTALLFLGTVLWCIGILKKQDWLAATGLALTTIRPHICLALAIPFLFNHRRVWWYFCMIAGILALGSILMLGREGTLSFINILLITASGTWYGTHQSAMLNLIGLMLRTLPFVQPGLIRIFGWVGYLVGICALCFVWSRASNLDERLLSTSIVIALFCAPHLHYHDLTLLIIPVIFAVTSSISTLTPQRLALVPLGISLLMIIEPLHYILPYVMYAALVWWFAKKNLVGSNPKKIVAEGFVT